ncbi:hypothetical protein HZA56_00335 [Candidatus Poribacteria bacterium]|nr:hypothetical protein [Candidatus Poribacteria bacterium]
MERFKETEKGNEAKRKNKIVILSEAKNLNRCEGVEVEDELLPFVQNDGYRRNVTRRLCNRI